MTSAPPQSVEIQRVLSSIHIEEWLNNDVLKHRWWVLLLLLVLSAVLWWAIVDKSKLTDACLYAAIMLIFALGLVEYGEELTLWDYPTDILSIFPPVSSINLIVLPLSYSILYQRFSQGKRFFAATLLLTAFICFILEPLLAWAGLYQLLHWHYYFSFPLYVVVAMIVRQLCTGISHKAGRAKLQ